MYVTKQKHALVNMSYIRMYMHVHTHAHTYIHTVHTYNKTVSNYDDLYEVVYCYWVDNHQPV